MKFFKIFLSLFVVASVFSCAPPEGEYYDTLEISMADSSDLVSIISGATESVELAFYDVTDVSIVSALNSAALAGVSVDILLDSQSTNSLSGLSPLAGVTYGNSYGEMRENFVIIDKDMIYQFASHDLTGETLMLQMYDLEMMMDYEAEFSQMYNDSNFASGSDIEDEKIRVNFHETYTIGESTVAVNFTPAQPFVYPFTAAVGNCEEELVWYADAVENQNLYAMWNDVLRSGLEFEVKFGAGSVSNTNSYPNMICSNATVYAEHLNFNALLIDPAMQGERTAVISSAGLWSHQDDYLGDAVVVTLYGAAVGALDSLMESETTGKVTTPVAVAKETVGSSMAFHDIVISEVVRRGMEESDGTRQALAKMIELRNMTSSAIDISGCKIVITNGNRLSEPATFNIPYGTVIQPSGFYVVVAKNFAFSYYDYHWVDFYIDRTFTISFTTPTDEMIDIMGETAPTGAAVDRWYGTYGTSIVRDIATLNDGTDYTEWSNETGSTNLFAEYSACNVTPGTD